MAYLGARMKISEQAFFLLLGTSLILAALFLWFQPKGEETAPFSAEKMNISVGGQSVVRLSRNQSGDSQPQILRAYILPGRAMNIYQLEAYLPGKGIIQMFRSPSLEIAKETMNGGLQDSYGEQSYFVGGAILPLIVGFRKLDWGF